MRIGMWNRLAITVSVLALIVVPVWLVISANLDFIDAYDAGYQQCVERAAQPNDGTLTFDACREIWPIGGESSYGWSEWGQALLATFIACILIYGLIWVFVQTVKWIWRGRQINE